MRVQQPVRDRNMSLWQSAVRQTLAGHDLTDDEKHRVEYGVSLHAKSEEKGKPLPYPILPGEPMPKVGPAPNLAHASMAVFDAIKVHQSGNTPQGSLFD